MVHLPEQARKDLEQAQRKLWAARQDLLDKLSFHLGQLPPNELMGFVSTLIKPPDEPCLEKAPRPFSRALEQVMDREAMGISGIVASLKARGWLSNNKNPRGYVNQCLCNGVRHGIFERVSPGRYRLVEREPQPRKRVKVTTDIVWEAITKIPKVGTLGFRTRHIIKVLGCRGEQLATPLAILRQRGFIERAEGKWFKLTEWGKKALHSP